MVLEIYTDEQCAQYGSFMHEVKRPAAETMYWLFFFTVLSILFGASWRFGRMMEHNEGLEVGDPGRERRIVKCFRISCVAFLFGLLITTMECFVLLTLQFCDQEPLISLYWSTWTMLQVGAVVAILGIALHTRHMIKGLRHPPWALALGTPVLVVAGLGHYFQGKLARGTRRIAASRSRSRHGRSRRRNEALSEAPTVRGDSTDSNTAPESSEQSRMIFGDASDRFNARIIGYTKEGDVILHISPELTQELGRPINTEHTVKWDEKGVSQTDKSETGNEKGGALEVENARVGRPRHRSPSDATSHKGKEKEPSLDSRRKEAWANLQRIETDSHTLVEGPQTPTKGTPTKEIYSPAADDRGASHSRTSHPRVRPQSLIQPISPMGSRDRNTGPASSSSNDTIMSTSLPNSINEDEENHHTNTEAAPPATSRSTDTGVTGGSNSPQSILKES